jgi:hypothetical protein
LLSLSLPILAAMALQQQRGAKSTVEQVDGFVVLGIFLPLAQHLSPTLSILAAQMPRVDFLEGVGVLCFGLVVDRRLGLWKTGNVLVETFGFWRSGILFPLRILLDMHARLGEDGG